MKKKNNLKEAEKLSAQFLEVSQYFVKNWAPFLSYPIEIVGWNFGCYILLHLFQNICRNFTICTIHKAYIYHNF